MTDPVRTRVPDMTFNPPAAPGTVNFMVHDPKPNIGEKALFSFAGADPRKISSVDWDFGGKGCNGHSTASYGLGLGVSLTAAEHAYASAGHYKVTAIVHMMGGTDLVGTGEVDVQAAGKCPDAPTASPDGPAEGLPTPEPFRLGGVEISIGLGFNGDVITGASVKMVDRRGKEPKPIKVN